MTIQSQIRDPVAVEQACQRLRLLPPAVGTHQLFSASATGLAVPLPGWNYPVVCETSTGRLRYDHFEGRWGDPAQLDRFLQAYAAEKIRIEARRQGHTVTEQPLEGGSIKLTVQVGGGL
ncbi:MAG: DUF1257 domain-containing protein [Pirellulales bacterium]